MSAGKLLNQSKRIAARLCGKVSLSTGKLLNRHYAEDFCFARSLKLSIASFLCFSEL